MKFSDMRSKEVICAMDGERLGFVSDMEFDENSGQIKSLLVPLVQVPGCFGQRRRRYYSMG